LAASWETRVRDDSVAANPAAASADVSGTASDPHIAALLHVRKRPHGRLYSSVALVLAIGIGAVFLVRQYSLLPRATRLFGKRAVTQFQLAVEPRPDGSLVVRWNRNSVQGAEAGLLHIEDGLQDHIFHLDSTQLASGFLLYSPATRDSTFRLDLFSRQGDRKSGLTRFVNGSVAPPPFDLTELAKHAMAATGHSNENPKQGSMKPIVTRTTAPVPKSARTRPHPVANTSTSSREVSSPVESLTPTLAAKTSDFQRPRNDSAENLSEPIYVPARPLNQVAPNPANLGGSLGRSHSIEIEVKVRIDEQGRVTEAQIVNNPSDDEKELASAALVAAKQWTFAPAKVRGRTVPSDHKIVFHFRPEVQP
jgi:TonB family protein